MNSSLSEVFQISLRSRSRYFTLSVVLPSQRAHVLARFGKTDYLPSRNGFKFMMRIPTVTDLSSPSVQQSLGTEMLESHNDLGGSSCGTH
eukprot:5830189-Amphidinium_carterae.2